MRHAAGSCPEKCGELTQTSVRCYGRQSNRTSPEYKQKSLFPGCVTGSEFPRTGNFMFIVYRFNEKDSYMMGDKKILQVLLLKTPNSLIFQALLIYTTEGLSVQNRVTRGICVEGEQLRQFC